MPYFFIPAEGRGGRGQGQIASTYRIKNHPDVTIWIENSDVGNYSDNNTEEANKPINQINDFWSQYEILPGISKIVSEWFIWLWFAATSKKDRDLQTLNFMLLEILKIHHLRMSSL